MLVLEIPVRVEISNIKFATRLWKLTHLEVVLQSKHLKRGILYMKESFKYVRKGIQGKRLIYLDYNRINIKRAYRKFLRENFFGKMIIVDFVNVFAIF